MSDIALRVEDLGKRYRLGAEQAGARRYKSLRDSLSTLSKRPLRALRNSVVREPMDESNSFWALQNVNFEVKRGEVVGIIGRNGAGKSTLLKILSRITKPTAGHVALYGRVGSLLEVGTGFHPELTGRENIFLNGAVLGMTAAEVRKKFDEIVAFSEIERFLDTAVKHYSSGMYTRLAFSVAAHLEPEILVIDEVLAVGDAEFQKKCLGKMGEIARGGRTVLFVSHNMNAVERLCGEALLLSRGEVVLQSTDVASVVSRYMRSPTDGVSSGWMNKGSEFQNNWFTPTRFCVVDQAVQMVMGPVKNNAKTGVLIEGTAEELNPSLVVGFAVYAATGELMYWSLATDQHPTEWIKFRKGRNVLLAELPPNFLNEGDYRLELIVSLHYTAWFCQPAVNAPSITLEIRGGLSGSPLWTAARPGLNAPILRFRAI